MHKGTFPYGCANIIMGQISKLLCSCSVLTLLCAGADSRQEAWEGPRIFIPNKSQVLLLLLLVSAGTLRATAVLFCPVDSLPCPAAHR